MPRHRVTVIGPLVASISVSLAAALGFAASIAAAGGNAVNPFACVIHCQKAAVDDQAENLPRIPAKEPSDALRTFQVLDGFRMDLLAHEPAVTDPVAMEYDADGWAYVAEMLDYPYTDKSTDVPNRERTTDLPIGRVRLLKDNDGDGVFDESYIFAEDLSWPTGLACWKGGVFVAATPDIWYLKDTDGDHRADVREKVFTGFRKFNVQAVMNNLKWGLDHQIYGAGGTNGAEVRTPTRPGAKPVSLSRHDFRFDPETLQFEAISGGARFGNTFDDWGNRFVCNIRNPAQHVVLPSHYLARNPFLAVPSALHDSAAAGDQLAVFRTSPPEPWRALRARRWAAEPAQNYPRSELIAAGFFTSACGVTVYRGAAYPQQYRGNIFVADVAGNLIHRLAVTPDGVTFAAKRADERREFVTSTDNWFRPVNFVNAPDGTLHILDMYRETIEHPWSIPDDIKAQLDLESGRDRGRIYRLTPPGFQSMPQPKLAHASTEQLVDCLANPSAWWRETAHRLIFERQDQTAVAPLRRLLKQSDDPLARLHALWSLQGLGHLQDSDLIQSLADASPGVREHAVRLSEQRTQKNEALWERIRPLAADPDARVRFQLAFSLGESPSALAATILAELASSDSEDEWMRTAIVSSCAERSALILAKILDRSSGRSPPAPALVRQLAQVVGARQQPAEIDRVVQLLADANRLPDARLWQSELAIGLGTGLKQLGKGLSAMLAGSQSEAAALVQQLIDEAQDTAANESSSCEERVQAVQLMGFGKFESVSESLAKLLDPRKPQAVQLAAVRAIASFVDPRVSQVLLGGWNMCTPPVRTEIVEALLARSDRVSLLLDSIEGGLISPSYLSAARKAALLRSANATIRDRASTLLGTDSGGPRKEVVARYEAGLSHDADRQHGERVYERECMTCHRFGDKGQEVGPDLASVLHHAPQQLLVNILDPNREVAPNYLEYLVALDDGRILTGIIAHETATTIVLRRAEGVQETVLRKNIAEIRSSGKSLMPEGLDARITVQEMADLIAFILNR